MKEYLQKLETDLVDNVMMKIIANAGIVIIRKRTLKGEFLEGSSSNAGQYSTKPFAMPFGVASKFLQSKLNKEKGFDVFNRRKVEGKWQKNKITSVSENDFKIFKAKNGNTWVLFLNGYRQFRQMSGKDITNTSLTWSGRMLRDLGVINVEKTKAEIDFQSGEEQQKAAWHTLMGAGKSKRKHVFMGFTKGEIEELTTLAEKLITKKLK